MNTGHSRPAKLLILADDLTGAGDSAIALAGPGGQADVCLDVADIQFAQCSVVALDLHTRGFDIQTARQRVASAARLLPGEALVFKKIDSTLRGHIGAELAALCAGLPRFADAASDPPLCIVAPAFPALGRTFEQGRLHIHGSPADDRARWGEGSNGVRPRLADQLQAHGLSCLSLEGDAVARADTAGLATSMGACTNAARGANPRAVICDARNPEDLRRIVRAGLTLPQRCIWVGSAGLAHALADELAMESVEKNGAQPAPCQKSLRRPGRLGFVVGSFSSVAHEQLTRLTATGQVACLPLALDMLAVDQIDPRIAGRIDAILAGGQDVALAIDSRGGMRPELSQALAAGLARVAATLRGRVAGLVCCGGDTSRALLEHVGARRLRVHACAEPGATLARCDALPGMPLILKAGAFGDTQTLLRLRQELNDVLAASAARPAPDPEREHSGN